jgi:hypothetical protein
MAMTARPPAGGFGGSRFELGPSFADERPRLAGTPPIFLSKGEHERVFNFLKISSGSPNFIGLDFQTSLLPGGQSVELIWRLVQQGGAAGISISALRDAINPEMVRIFGRSMKPKWLTQYLEQLPSTFVLDTTSYAQRTFVRLTSGALTFEGEGEQRTQPRSVPKQRPTPTVTVTPSPRVDVAPPRDETPHADDEPRCRYLCFSNLPHGCSSDELETLLEPLGKVEEVHTRLGDEDVHTIAC